ncbi:hypothetical protein EDC04DRAFT_2601947 [Pisolithus marmoratus]|nr:hypothetical protein EDC04DRAFT_2601947 [Pisolithus marmoratus]
MCEKDNAEHAMDEEGVESGIGEEQPDDYFNLAELEILAQRQREWMQARKKEMPIILWEIYKEFGKMEENCNLRPAEQQEKEEHITAWLKKPLRSQKPCITVRSAYEYSVQSVVRELYHKCVQEKHALMKNESTSEGNNQWIDLYQQALTTFVSEDLTKEELQARVQLQRSRHGEIIWTANSTFTKSVNRNVKKYGLKFMKNFAEEMWRYCRMRMVCLSGWKDGDGVVQACCWRDYLGTAYANSDVAEGEGVPNVAVNCPRAKKSDPVELVTSEEAAMELLAFWHEQQVSNPDDVFSFEKWLDQSGNLQPPSKGHSFPLKTTQKGSCHSEEIHSSVDEDTDPDTKYEGTSFSPPHSYESIQTSNITGHSQKKIPMPHKVHHSWKHPTSPDGNLADEDGDPDIPYEELCLTEVLQDTSEHEDSDGFESVPFTDDCTANPGPLGQHQKNRQLKSTLKQIPRAEQCSTSEPQPRKPKKQNREVSPRQQWAGSDDGHIALSAEEGPFIGSQWKSPQACCPPPCPDADAPSPPPKKLQKTVKSNKPLIWFKR